MKKTLILASLVLASSAAMAATPSFDSLGLEYSKQRGGSPVEAFSVDFSKTFMDQFLVSGSATDYSKGLGQDYRLSLGMTHDFMPRVTGFVQADALHVDGVSNDTGWGVTAGVRAMLMDQVEAGFQSSYSDLFDDTSWEHKLGVQYHFMKQFSVGAGYTFVKDSEDFWSLRASYHF